MDVHNKYIERERERDGNVIYGNCKLKLELHDMYANDTLPRRLDFMFTPLTLTYVCLLLSFVNLC